MEDLDALPLSLHDAGVDADNVPRMKLGDIGVIL
jgi:hypothetical protein